MRKLATIRVIKDIQPIKGADRIEVASVGGWDVVIGKNVGHSVGDKVVYCEIDSFLPIEPEFEFLRKTSYKKMADESEGFRLKNITMRGKLSQGLIIPLQDAQEIINRKGCETALDLEPVGTDVTQLLGIRKYEKPIPSQLSGVMKGDFPSFIIKTDAERIQNLTEDFSFFNDRKWEVTEKLDGSSFTCYLKDNQFGVCSHNIELEENDTNTFWKVARDLKLEEKIRGYFGTKVAFSIQGELIGEGIQGNPYKIKGQTIRFFNGFDIDTHTHTKPELMRYFCENIDIKYVPVIDTLRSLNIKSMNDIKQLINDADGQSALNENTSREGLVFQSVDGKYKFKTISNKFLNGE